MVRADIPTSFVVRSDQRWRVSPLDAKTFEALFSVEQQISENEKNRMVTSAYSTSIHVDKQGNMVIIKTPTLDSQLEKSN